MKESGLRFKTGVIDQAHNNINPNDKLYDSRSGLAAYYRYTPRDIDQWSRAATGVRAKVDGTALERIDRAAAGYAPGNLPFDFEVVDTTGERSMAAVRTQQSVEHRAGMDGYGGIASLSSAKQILVHLRKWLHALFVTTTISLVLAVYFTEGVARLLDKLGIGPFLLNEKVPELPIISKTLTGLKVLLPSVLDSFLTSLDLLFRNYPWILIGLLAWIVTLYAARFFLHRMTDGAYDEFWSNVRGDWRTERNSSKPKREEIP